MAIEKKLIHFSRLSDFETQLNAGNILDYSIIFIQDAKKIWTHGQYYDCNGGNGTSDSPTFLRIGDADDEAKANFIAVANGEKSADYYICASNIEGTEVNGIISELSYDGVSSTPSYISYTFYGTPIKGSRAEKILKIRTGLTPSAGIINTIYEAILDSKQDTITDLEDIREGASKGATSVQPDDISEFITAEDVATVATSGSYEDLTDKPVYITDFDVLSLYNIAPNPDGGLQADKQAIIDALAANKIVLVPYEISNNVIYRGYATLVGYTEDLLYFKVITDIDEIIVETSLDQADIYGQEVTLRQWSDKQDQLISGTNIKTINGQSLIGSGDIVISGGSSSGSSAYSEVSHGTADTTFTLTPNTFHIWNEVNSLTLTLGAETIGVANEYLFQFTSGSEPTTLSLPDDIKWTGGEAPTIESNKIYQVSILKGLGSVLEWDTVKLITFSVGGNLYEAVEGMTWEQWINSEYNIDNYYISSDIVRVDSMYCVTLQSSAVGIPPTAVIQKDYAYNKIFDD